MRSIAIKPGGTQCRKFPKTAFQALLFDLLKTFLKKVAEKFGWNIYSILAALIKKTIAMKKIIYMGMGLLLCLSAVLFTGCDKEKTPEIAMVYVEGGTFMMGATEEQGDDAWDSEKPVHSVTLDGFYIGKFEVTQAQWAAVMGTTVSQQRDTAAEYYGQDPSDWSLYGVGDNYPMYYVSWEEAQSFCEKLSAQTGKKYRLPTEAEWEYAARGGNNADGTKYAGSGNLDEVAWYRVNSDGENGNVYGTHPVGTKRPNGLGIYDMSGNVWEWCQDWYGSYGSSSAVNPQGPSSGSYRVRGGCWASYARLCRV